MTIFGFTMVSLKFSSVRLIIDFAFFLQFIEHGIHYVLFCVYYFFGLACLQYFPLKDFNKTLHRPSKNMAILLLRLQKFQRMYIFYLKEFVFLNKYGISTYFCWLVTINV